MLINSTLDILWIAIAFVVLWIGIWLGLSAFYLAMSVRDARQVVGGIKKKLTLVNGILSGFKKKSDSATSFIPPLVDGITKIVKMAKEQKKSKSKDRK